METVFGTMTDLYQEIKNQGNRTLPTLLRSSKTGIPLGAYAPNGNGGGSFYSRKTIEKRNPPSHCYGGSQEAYDTLLISKKRALSKRKIK